VKLPDARQTVVDRYHYQFLADLILEVEAFIKEERITIKEFCAKAGVSKTTMLNLRYASTDVWLSTIVKLALAIGKRPFLEFKPYSTVSENLTEYKERKER
jgi:transcriptional regulator with XRE-family HTH domain